MLLKIKNVIYLLGSLIFVGVIGCSRVNSVDNISNMEGILVQITENLSYNIDIRDRKNQLINSFVLTDMKQVRKLSLKEAVMSGLLGEGLYDELKKTFPDDSFVLLMWDKWYREWKSGKVITPYFAYDPMIDESKITSVVLYKKGKPVKTIDIKEFDNYPVIVVSPEWWEGNMKQKDLEGGKSGNYKSRAVTYSRGMYIGKNFDGSWNPMEIYTVCAPAENHDYAIRTDFNSGQWDVNWANRWYYFDPIRISPYYTFTNPIYVNNPQFDCLVKEADGGLRFSDDFVGEVYIVYQGSGYYYYSGGYARLYAHIGFVE